MDPHTHGNRRGRGIGWMKAASGKGELKVSRVNLHIVLLTLECMHARSPPPPIQDNVAQMGSGLLGEHMCTGQLYTGSERRLTTVRPPKDASPRSLPVAGLQTPGPPQKQHHHHQQPPRGLAAPHPNGEDAEHVEEEEEEEEEGGAEHILYTKSLL